MVFHGGSRDMTAWVKTGTSPVIGIIQDFVDPEFTAFVTKVVAEYGESGSPISLVLVPHSSPVSPLDPELR